MASQGAGPKKEVVDASGTFASMDLGLDRRLLKAVARQGFVAPTLVQAASIPQALKGKDLLVQAKTGSGKTAAYALAVMQKILLAKADGAAAGEERVAGAALAAVTGVARPRGLILVPTRELVDQTVRAVEALAYYCSDVLRVAGVVAGGAAASKKKGSTTGPASSSSSSAVALTSSSGGAVHDPDIVVATPARAAALVAAGRLELRTRCDSFVVDEADLVLSYGGEADVRAVVAALPRICQSILVSATLSNALAELKRLVLHSAVVLRLQDGGEGGASGGAGGSLSQFYVRVTDVDRYLLLYALLKLRLIPGKALFFVNDADSCFRLKLFLERFGIRAGVLNPELPVNSRLHTLHAFNKGAFDYLIATDASLEAGMDVEDDGSGADESDEEEEDGMAAAVAAVTGSRRKRTNSSDDSDDSEEEEDARPAAKRRKLADGVAAAAGAGSEDEGAAAASKKGQSKAAKAKAAAAATALAADEEYGVARGVDFRNVSTVVNVDCPRSVSSYVHRVGRTGRGGASGVAVTFFDLPGSSPAQDALLAKLQNDTYGAAAAAAGGGPIPGPLPFDLREVEGFRYRVTDVLNGIGKTTVRNARLAAVKAEILASEALAAHFEDNPRDLALLKHDRSLGDAASAQPHLKDVPGYLLPPTLRAAVEAAGAGLGATGATGDLLAGKKRKRKNNKKGDKGKGGKGGAGGGDASSGAAPAASAAAPGGGVVRVSAAAAVALAQSEVYHARRNNTDPLKALQAARRR